MIKIDHGTKFAKVGPMEKPLARRSKQKPDADRRRELADFLRTRRERLKPDVVGPGRRRTPGLRREEVAEQAGVGVSWYTWLEQGRDIQPSIELLRSLSKVLQLSPFESRYLFQLAGRPLPDDTEEHETEIPESVRRFVMETLALPAYIIDDRFNFLMANDLFEESFYQLNDLPAEDRNWLHFVFTNPKFRALNPDWEAAARRVLAEFRLSIGKQVTSVWAKDLIKRLSITSPQFAQWWKAHDVLERRSLITQSPVGAESKKKYERSTYIPLDAENLRINILTPIET